MGKLHELVAVEKDVRGTAAKITSETNTTFSKKHQLFNTHSKLYQPLKEGDLEKPEEEQAQPITTIGDKLKYFEGHMIRLFDIILQKEDANSKAKENIVIVLESGDKITLAENVPVQALVQLENQIELLRANVYDVIPTLDPTKNWKADTAAGAGKFLTDKITRQRTNKIPKPLVLHPGTDKHPPQVQMINEDVVVGTWDTVFYSGLISPANKSDLLARIDAVLEAIKKARSRANEQTVENIKIGKRLFQFINEGK